jgi:serine O-acetyltransferase
MLHECRYSLLRKIYRYIGPFTKLLIQTLTGISIATYADIGPGFYIGHYGSIFIGGNFGKMCNVSHECTVGWAGRGEARGLPQLGDFTYIAPGAKIFGKIKIGKYVAIGANSVVTKSLENNAVAVGIPAKVISYKGSSDLITYNEEKFKPILV